MKNFLKKLAILVIPMLLVFSVAQAVTIFNVNQGGTGVGTITGIPYGTGTSPLGTVTIGSGLSFVGGTLSSSGGSGTVTAVSVSTSNGFAGSSSGGATPALTLSTTVTGILSGNGTAISAATTTGSGSVVLATSPTLITPVLGAASASGLTLSSITGSTQCLHVNTSGVVSGTGSDCGSGGGGLTVGSTGITSGTNTRILYDNSGILGEYTLTGTGTVVAMQTSPSFTTPNIGVATATSVNKLTITAPATSATLTIADGKTLTSSNTLTLAGTDGKGINVGAATSGKILIGDGSNMVLSTPTFPNTSATSGKIIKSDGTNWIASTETYAVPGTSGNIMTSNGTNWTSASPTVNSTYPTQDIPLAVSASTPTDCISTSDATGTQFFFACDNGGTTGTIYRMQKDANTSNYYVTAITALTINSSGFSPVSSGMAVIGSNLYVSTFIGGVNSLRRYAAADLSGVTSMTFSGTSRKGAMFADASALYIWNGSTDNFDKFTISGTTATNAATITYTSSGTLIFSAISDGTNVWLNDTNGTSPYNIRKYPIAGGSPTSTTSPIITQGAYYNGTTVSMFLGSSSILSLAWGFSWTNPTTALGQGVHVFGITLP